MSEKIMKVDWEDVQEDYKNKDARIAELEYQLSNALWGWSPRELRFIVKNQHWSEYLLPRFKNGLIDILRDRGIDGELKDYGSLVDVVEGIIGF